MNAGGWVKLPRQESPAFRRLSLVARGIAAELLKLTDDEGFIDLGTRSLDEMPRVLKRSLGGDRYDMKAMQRHLPALVEARAYVVRGTGLQAGEWAGYELPLDLLATSSTRVSDSIEAPCELVRSPLGTSYEPHTGSLGVSKPAESLSPQAQKERKTERHTEGRVDIDVSGFRAREIFTEVFAKWRAHHKCEWAPGRKDFLRIDEVSLKLIPVSRARSIPFRRVVAAALRGYTQTDAKEKRYSLAWFAKDASAYLTPRSFEKTARAIASEKPKEEEERMTYGDAVKAGLIDPSASRILEAIGTK